MVGGTLALLNHSLQLDWRLLRHHIYRLSFVLILYLFVWFATGQSLFVGAPGQWLFGWIAYLNFWFITLAGISYFATVISEEKEEETLGILRMAGISPTALLLGKSTSRLLVAALLLSMQFPFAMLAITLGGVTPIQVQAVFLALLAYTAFVANLALFCSVVARRANRASTLTASLLGIFFFGPWLVNAIVIGFTGSIPTSGPYGTAMKFVQTLTDVSVFNRLGVILSSKYVALGPDAVRVSLQVTSNLVAAFVLFVVSRLIFDRVTRYHAVARSSRGILIRPTGRLKFLSTGRSWGSALIWKDFHFITGGKPMLLLKSIGYGLLIAFAVAISLADGSANPFIGMSFWIIFPVTIILLIEATLAAARVFREEVQLNALSSLMLLPLTPAGIAYRKVAGCLIGLAPAAICLTTGLILLVVGIVVEGDPDTAFGSVMLGGYGIVHGVTFIVFFVHLVAYLSLVVKWGAIPLSIAISLLLFAMTGCFIALGGPAFVFTGGAVGLHFMIASRFRQLGME